MAKLSSILPSDPRWKTAQELCQEREQAPASLPLPILNHLLINGLTRGTLVEANGLPSSGKSALCLHVLARATQNGEICAVVDFDNSLHPDSAHECGVRLERLLWVRCKCNLEYTIKTADLLLHAGGFGVVLLDLGGASAKILQRIPISYWYRFQRVIQNTPTILLVCAQTPQAKAAASHESLACEQRSSAWWGQAPFTRLGGIQAFVRKRKLATLGTEKPLPIAVA